MILLLLISLQGKLGVLKKEEDGLLMSRKGPEVDQGMLDFVED